MACNRPLPAWLTKSQNENGKYPVTFQFSGADTSRKVQVPCGHCMGCRLDRARQWAIRMVHESKCHKHNAFITLTYDDTTVPRTDTGLLTLRPQDFVLFMKRLRKAKGPGVRFYQCGEYGETTERPHHHAILFNCQFTDLKPVSTTRTRDARTLYNSKELEKLWQQGICSVGAVNFETAAYVASYVTKKFTARNADDHLAHYQGRVPEYATMSRRPGIARPFYEDYAGDFYPSDEVIVRGHPMRPPKYYDRILEKEDPDLYYAVRDAREARPTTHREREAREQNIASKAKTRDFQ